MEKLKRIARKVRWMVVRFFVKRYAIIKYYRAVNKAKEMNEKLFARYYVVQEGKLGLKIMGRRQYRDAKKRFLHNTPNSVMLLKKSAYFYTPDRFGNDGMSVFEEDARKRAWIRHCYDICM